MLSDTQLAYMRAAQNETLVDTCDILRLTRSPDGKGGSIEQWATHLMSQPCRFAPVAQTQRNADGVLRTVTETILTLAWDVDVTDKDRVIYGGATYAITGEKPHTWITAKRLAVQKI